METEFFYIKGKEQTAVPFASIVEFDFEKGGFYRMVWIDPISSEPRWEDFLTYDALMNWQIAAEQRATWWADLVRDFEMRFLVVAGSCSPCCGPLADELMKIIGKANTLKDAMELSGPASEDYEWVKIIDLVTLKVCEEFHATE